MPEPITNLDSRCSWEPLRPWDFADNGSIWEITGQSPDGKFSFNGSLAMMLVEPTVAGVEPSRVLAMIPGGGSRWDLVPPSWVAHAKPLILVCRDDPNSPYDARDRVYLAGNEHGEPRKKELS